MNGHSLDESIPATTNAGTTIRRSWFSQQRMFVLKELRETLRDRRTILTLLAMPLLLYPLLGLGFRFLAVQQLKADQVEYRIALPSEPEGRWFQQMLLKGEQLLENDELTVTDGSSVVDLESIQFFVPEPDVSLELDQLVALSEAELAVRVQFSDGAVSSGLPRGMVKLIVREGSLSSLELADFVKSRMTALNQRALSPPSQIVTIEAAGMDLPFSNQTELISPATKPNALLSLLPLVLLLMTVTGGVYPAIDLTAGERERNTMETLMALPVPSFRLLLAKFVAVLTVIVLTGVMNLLAMSVTMYSLQLETTLFGASGLTATLLLKLAAVLAMFALFYAAVLLCVTCSARSFKEAQAYLIPLLLLSIAPGLVIVMPGWSLTWDTAVIPLVNMLLLAREFLEGTVSAGPAMLALVTTSGYGLAALLVAGRLFGGDAVSAGSVGNWNDLWNRPQTQRQQAGLPLVIGVLAAMFPLYFVASSLLSRVATADLSLRLILSGVMTAVLFAGIPLALLVWQRVKLSSGLLLMRPGMGRLAGAVLIGLSTWPWVFELVIWFNSLGFASIDAEKFEQVGSLLAAWKSVPFGLVLVVLGVLPGVCEELFFRGFVMNSLQFRIGAGRSIVVAAVAFGLFHVVMAGGAAPERVLPSTVMGLLLGWVAWRCGSLFPAMLLHVVHNSTLLTVARYETELTGLTGSLEQTHLPTAWLIVAGIVLAAGVGVVGYRGKQPTRGT